jgi:molybdate transport repressor ModE-like protein
MDPAALRTMRAIAEAGTISAAARSLGTSQPAISQQVRRLERRLGTALLERVGRGIRLTEAGQVLARHGGAVAAALDAASEEVAALTGLRAGRVRLMSFPSSSATLVPRALALLRDRHPGLHVQLAEAEPPESLVELREGRCDIAVAFTYPDADTGAPDLEGLVARPLLDDRLWLALPSRLDGARALPELRDETWIAGCPRCRGHLLRLTAAAGYEPEIAYATDDSVAVLGLVAAGLGVALLPGLALEAVARPGVVLRPLEPASVRTVHAVTTPDLLRVPAVNAALDALGEAAVRPAAPAPRAASATAARRGPGR